MDRKNKNTWTGTLRGKKKSRNKEEKKTRVHTIWTLLLEHVSLN